LQWLAFGAIARYLGRDMSSLRLVTLSVAAIFAAFAVACSSTPSAITEPPSGGTDAGADTAAPVPTEPESTGATQDMVASTLLADLTKAKVDVRGDLSAQVAEKTTRDAIMKSFTKALGVGCDGCHKKSGTQVDYSAETPEKNVTALMWKNWVGQGSFKDGSPLYCDSCHQGTKKFLDRTNDTQLGAWMRANFAAKLLQADDKPFECRTCHGSPFKGDFLTEWEKTPE